jgi:hypothetical protein
MVTSPAPSLTGLTLEAIIGKQVDSLFAAPQGPRKLAAPFQHVFLRNVADATVCFHLEILSATFTLILLDKASPRATRATRKEMGT